MRAPDRTKSKRGWRSVPVWLWIAGGTVLAGIVLASLSLHGFRAVDRGSKSPGPASNAPFLENEKQVFAQYGGSASCRECHEEDDDKWKPSNHALAERNVRADMDRRAFDPARSFGQGVDATHVEWKDGKAQIAAVGLSGGPETFSVARVIGNDPLRQFLVPFPGGRMQALEAAYDPHSNQWFNVYGTEEREPGEWGHWTGRGMNWNYMCAGCHNTRLRKNYDAQTDTYHTAMAEMSVGCEACHGPLKAHNDWQRQFGKSGQKDPTVTKPSKEQILDYCGFCHARRSDLTGDFKPGDRFLDHFSLTIVDESDTYYPDGQIRDEDYEYASFLSSRMHFRGVYCLDCHDPHSMKTILPGNWLCMRCHNGTYTNAPVIAPVEHSHHKVYGYDTNGQAVNFDLMAYKPKEIKETGGECVNCHMPQTLYMQRHWRHDHGFTIPDPLLTKQLGIPNACNRCHQDKDTQWSLDAAVKWYGSKMDRPTRTRAQAVARARAGEPEARQAMLGILTQEPIAYWQAVAAGLLEPWATDTEVTRALVGALENTNALVRGVAARSLDAAVTASAPGVEAALRRRLADPSRNVRVAAAWSLRSVLDLNSPATRDLMQYLDVNCDEPAGQTQLGMFCYARNDLDGACRHLHTALKWDPRSPPIREQLAVLMSALNRPQEALALLKEGCRLCPQDAGLHFQFGLACNEAGNLKEAAGELETATTLDPRLAPAWYNLGLARSALGDPEAALEALLRAETLAPRDPRIPYARATILARLGRTRAAVEAAGRALELQPSYPEARQLLDELSK